MKNCEFCLSEFEPRPQVKNPRACKHQSCQRQRQRANEKEWRNLQVGYPGENYYQIRKLQRKKRITDVVQSLIKCFEAGRKFFGVDILMEEFSQILEAALFRIGVRRINKFWQAESFINSNHLESSTKALF